MMVTHISLLLLCLCFRSDGRQVDRDRENQVVLSDGLCRYGNSVECCWGWTRAEWGRCRPHCPHGCKHGECVGPDRCKCHPGYTGKACNHDLNECGLKPRPCRHRCMNTPGSYKCYCPDGFKMEADGTCRNTRTCFHANCQYGCEVVKGAVRCTCPSPGLRLGPDRRTCIDINECMLGGAVCPPRRKCINTFGSFLCKCHLGFRLTYIDGRYSCIDKDPRPFCTLNPAAPKCRCEDGSCKGVPKVHLKPHRPRTTTTPPAPTTLTTVSIATLTTAAPRTSATPVISTTLSTIESVPNTSHPSTSAPHTSVPLTPVPSTALAVTTTTAMAATTSFLTATKPVATPPGTSPVTRTAMLTSTATVATPTTSFTPETTDIQVGTSVPATSGRTLTTGTRTTTGTMLTTGWTPTTGTMPTKGQILTTGRIPTTTVDNRINRESTPRQRGDVHIPRHDIENQVWDFDIELGLTADDAQDDPGAGGRHCGFDRGICDWMWDVDGDLSWESVESPAGGRFLSVQELKPGQRSIRGARLVVPVDPGRLSREACFLFSHHLAGNHVGVLQLFLRQRGRHHRYSPASWTRTGGHGWRRTQVTVETQTVDRVLIKAERRRGRRGIIAVDDITLVPGACR